jgi:hypothetical protein
MHDTDTSRKTRAKPSTLPVLKLLKLGNVRLPFRRHEAGGQYNLTASVWDGPCKHTHLADAWLMSDPNPHMVTLSFCLFSSILRELGNHRVFIRNLNYL